jgi:hypothetical protein
MITTIQNGITWVRDRYGRYQSVDPRITLRIERNEADPRMWILSSWAGPSYRVYFQSFRISECMRAAEITVAES